MRPRPRPPERAWLPAVLLAAAVLAVAWGDPARWPVAVAPLQAWRDWWFRALAADVFSGQAGAGDALRVFLTGGVGPDLFSPVDLYLFSAPGWVLGFGPAAASLKVLLILGANAAAGYLLGLTVSRNPWGGLLAGCVLAFNPYGLSAGILAFPALFAACLLRLQERDSPGRVTAAAAALGLSFLTSPLMGVLAVLLGLALLATGEVRPSRALAATVGGAALLAAPFYAPLVVPIAQGAYPNPWPAALPGPLEAKMAGEHRHLHETSGTMGALSGFNPLLLALLLLPLARGQGVGPWYLAVLVGYVLTLGPYLRTAQGVVLQGGDPVPLPFLALYRWVPGMTWVKSPAWFSPLLFTGLAAVGALNVEALRRWFEDRPSLPILVTGVVLAVSAQGLVNERLVPLPREDRPVAAFYGTLDPRTDRLVESPGTGDRALLDLAQAGSGVPVLAGAADREALPGLALPTAERNRTPAAVARLETTRFLLEPGRFPFPQDAAADLQVLRSHGYTVLALHEYLAAELATGPQTFDALVEKLAPLLGAPQMQAEPRGRLAVFRLKGAPAGAAKAGG